MFATLTDIQMFTGSIEQMLYQMFIGHVEQVLLWLGLFANLLTIPLI